MNNIKILFTNFYLYIQSFAKVRVHFQVFCSRSITNITLLVFRNRCFTPASFDCLAFLRCLFQDKIQSLPELEGDQRSSELKPGGGVSRNSQHRKFVLHACLTKCKDILNQFWLSSLLLLRGWTETESKPFKSGSGRRAEGPVCKMGCTADKLHRSVWGSG
jgi:hypothetical protein